MLIEERKGEGGEGEIMEEGVKQRRKEVQKERKRGDVGERIKQGKEVQKGGKGENEMEKEV